MNNLRKILAVMLCCAMLMSCLPVALADNAESAAGTDYQTLQLFESASGEAAPLEEIPVGEVPAEEKDNGLLNIKAVDYEIDNGVLLYYNGTAETFNVPSGVTEIAGYAFESNASVKKVVLSAGVKIIGSNAFANCTALTSVTIPDSVNTIGDHAFSGSALTGVTLPAGVTTIAESTFASCAALASVTIPASVTTIDKYAFSGCTALTSVSLPSGLTALGASAFAGCSALTTVNLPAGVTVIADRTFMSCYALKNVSLPAGTTKIGAHAFFECGELTGLTVPASVTAIGENAFYGCNNLTLRVDNNSAAHTYCEANAAAQGFNYELTSVPAEFTVNNGVLTAYTGSAASVKIPAAVTSIGDNAFKNNTTLQSVQIPASVTSIGANAFSGCTALTGVEIPASVTSIGAGAFNNCNALTTVTIPAGVTNIGEGAFAGCDNLTAVNVAEGNTKYMSADGVLYNAAMTTLLCYPAGKTGSTFVLPTSVTSIGAGAFAGNTSLTTITIPAGVTNIGAGAFAGCTNLTVTVQENSAAHAYMLAHAAEDGIQYTVIPGPATLPRPSMGLSYVISSLKLRLTWEAVEGAQGYELWRSDSPNGTYTKVADTTELEKIDDCMFGKINYYKVRAYTTSNGSRVYSPYSVYRSCFGLATPGIQKLEMVDEGVKITAATVANATGYYIYRCENQYGLYDRLGTTTLANGVNTFVDTTAEQGVTYYYKCRAYHTSYLDVAEGVTYVGPFSVGKSILCDYVQLGRAVMGAHTVLSSLKLKLTWQAVEGATGYELWRSDAADGTYTKVADITTLQHIDDCIFGKINYYKVRAYHESERTVNGETETNRVYGPFSVYRSSFGLATPGIQKLESTAEGIKITHASVANATGYYISRGESKDGPFTRIGQSSVVNGENVFIDTTAVAGKTYYYRCNVYHISYTYVATGVTYVGPLSVAKPCTR